jgi:hypothetical protein
MILKFSNTFWQNAAMLFCISAQIAASFFGDALPHCNSRPDD